MTTYEVLISRDLLDQLQRDDSRLPVGFRIGPIVADAAERCHYVQVEDDDAPDDLTGQVVDVALSGVDGQPRATVAWRRPLGRRTQD